MAELHEKFGSAPATDYVIELKSGQHQAGEKDRIPASDEAG
ncbi:MAG: hypothetical protein R6V43_13525 [Halopseudomonas sp.]